jgi:sterol desaturase/sphingolipid hydroxylase (fatty acid hydroxylase superfamily)
MGVNGTLGLYFMPIFFALIAWEYFSGRRRGKKLYSTNETMLSVIIALVQRLIAVLPLAGAAMFTPSLYELRLFSVTDDVWWYYPVLFLAVEFCYYWFHRASHEVRWFWATHSVHHSIEEMNVLGAYRLGWTGKITMASIVYSPLYVIGFEPAAVVVMTALVLFYQSWLHTTLIGKLGWLEGILNTPSSHRVHHAKNADYLDRNHGGVTMLFDRLFGTYVEEREDEPVVFGLVKPSNSTNPIRVALAEWINIIQDLRNFPGPPQAICA